MLTRHATWIMTALVLLSGGLHAQADTPEGEGPQMTTAPGADGTTVIGAEEAPTVLNVVPWKDSQVELQRDDPSSALLNRVLEPLDQDVLKREIQYHRMMNVEDEDDGLFLD